MGSRVDDPGALWTFFIVVVLTVTILLVAVGAAMFIGHRRLVEAHADFTRRLVQVQDQERARIAAEVHDDLGTHVSLIRTSLAEQDPAAALQGAADELGDLAARIRGLAHRLHPSRVDQVGLDAALARLAEDLQDELRLTVHLDSPGEPLVRGPAGFALYRIIQEALRNGARHGGASEAWVTLRRSGESVEAEVRDAGSGFDPERARTQRGGGIGLALMRERAGVVGGTVTVTSRPGAGTVVLARVPLPAPGEAPVAALEAADA